MINPLVIYTELLTGSFAHLLARLKVQVKQILESVAVVCDTDLYVTPLM